MRRAKLGDVFAVKVPNGYKIVQWAYHIKKFGRFIRVFDGLYEKIPEKIDAIVVAPHSYITDMDINRAYRIGLLCWLGNYPVPMQYPFPKYSVQFWFEKNGSTYAVDLLLNPGISDLPHRLSFSVNGVDELPTEYRQLNLLNSRYSLDWLLYLFDNDYSLSVPHIQYPIFIWGENWRDKYQVYIDIVEAAIKNDPLKK